ncbi:hypothetical protein F750_1343 [Streptomyces sp. PAMC 26508]|nr:hypothetical protein F750_1343 [Streptomyces sp. PAMC 26508]
MIQCPKCHAQMHTYNRNGVQIEQCSGCRGIFLDYGELESLTRLESQWAQQAPPAPPARRPTPPRRPPPGARRTRAVTTAATTARRASAGCCSVPDPVS